MIYPNWKIILAEKYLKNGEKCQYEDVNILVSLLKKEHINKDAIQRTLEAYEIYKQEAFVKEVIESCLLCEDYEEDMCSYITGVPANILEVYSVLFFDISVFKYKLHRYEYVRQYENPDYPDGKLYKKWAVSVGMEFFKWKFNSALYEAPPKRILSSLVGDAFFRAKEHLGESITSPVAKEAMKWIKQTIDSAKGIREWNSQGSDNVIDDFRMALEFKEETKKMNEISDAQIIT